MAQSLGSRRKKWKKTKPYNSPKPEDVKLVTGSWKVSDVLYESYNKLDRIAGGLRRGQSYEGGELEEDVLYNQVPGPDYQGVEVTFDDQCDVAWSLPKGVEPIPLFQTTSYNIDGDCLDLIGGVHGRTFHFQVEPVDKGDVIHLKTPLDNTSDAEDSDSDEREVGGANSDEGIGDMIIVLDRVKVSVATDEGFSLKDALLEGYFSDLTITSTDGQTFNVHRTVLDCVSPNMTYREWEMLLRTLKGPLTSVVLNYIYSGTLPSTSTVALVQELLAAISSNPKLANLVDLCNAFIGSYDLKQRLLQLIDDIQASIAIGKKLVENTEISNPVKVTYGIKQLAREAIVAVTKFGLLCELYTRNKKDMNKAEKQEVLEYLRARIVVFVDQTSELVDMALDKYHSLSDEQREELATYIIPEVERIWDLVNATCGDSQAAVIAGVTSLTKRKRFNRQEIKLSMILQFVAHGGELKKLQRIRKEFAEFVVYSTRKREEFRDFSDNDKVERILRGMTALKREGIGLMKELNEAKEEILINNALDWKKYKILVAVCCSYVTWGVRKLQALKAPLTPVLLKACKFIQRSEVVDALVYLDLLNEEDLKMLRDDDDDNEGVESRNVGGANLPSLEPLKNKNSTQLAQGCLKLLESLEHSDMHFVLQPQPATPTEEDVGVASSEPVVVPAHRVIVSARCEWLMRALTCGMREAIDKRITIHGCDEGVFRKFLKYLYSGALDTESMSLDDVIEVLAVADQYETTSLRVLCEGVLVNRVEDSNVFFLLQVADRFSARKLREATLQHIIDNHDVIMTEVDAYSSLPEELKDELRALLSTPDPSLLLRHNYRGTQATTSSQQQEGGSGYRGDSSGSESSGSFGRRESTEFTAPPTASQPSVPDFKMDPEFHDPDTLEFQSKLDLLKSIVGSEAPEELLKDVLLAADMDTNRAANFYFNTQQTGGED